jgi:hypothetical protein
MFVFARAERQIAFLAIIFTILLVAACGGGGSGGNNTPSGPAAPTGLVATAIGVSISLSWTGGAPSYAVYRSTAPGVQPVAGNQLLKVGTNAFHDQAVDSLTKYYYVVTADAGNGIESSPSAEVSATTTALPAPIVAVASSADQVLITFHFTLPVASPLASASVPRSIAR